MRRKIGIIIGGVLIFFSVAGAVSGPQNTPVYVGDRIPFSPGEHLRYSIRVPALFGATVAYLNAYLMDITNIRNMECYKVKVHVQTARVVKEMFNYNLNDVSYDYFDAHTFEMIRIIAVYHEGSNENYVVIDTMPENNTYRYRDAHTNFTTSYRYILQGRMSMIYRARVLRLEEGDNLLMSLSDGPKTVEVTGRVSRGHNVQVPAFGASMPAIKVSQSDNAAHVWLSDNERRIPIMITSRPIEVFGAGLLTLSMKLEGYSDGHNE